MKIAFIDLSPIEFDIQTPEKFPLGGMQSGLCYLSAALQKLGHDVTIFNSISSDRDIDGIEIKNFNSNFRTNAVNDFDVFVSISCRADTLRPLIQNRPLILFSGHNSEEPSMRALSNAAERNAWDKFVFKSNWQAETLRTKYALDPKKISIISNAAAPYFIELAERKSFFFNERRPPVLYYSSTPHRGLEILARSFPIIKQAIPGTRAMIYSSMKPYHALASDAQFQNLYDYCRSIGMEYIGSLNQKDLAEAITSADLLAFPSTYPETSCITIMEAMLNSSLIVSRSLGAIPETCAGFGLMALESQVLDFDQYSKLFAEFTVKVVNHAYSNPKAMELRLRQQRQFALNNYDWKLKANEWDTFLKEQFSSNKVALDTNTPNKRGNPFPIFNFVQTRSGKKIYISPSDHRSGRLLYSGGNLNPATHALWTAALHSSEWDIVIDVGANYGEMLIDTDGINCTKIFAVEPNPLVLPYLSKTISHLANVEIIPMALSGTEGRQSFSINRNWSGMSRLGAGPDQIEVDVSTVDILLRQRFSNLESKSVLIKIDVEGSELDVMSGAAATIQLSKMFCGLIEVAHLSTEQCENIEKAFDIYGLRMSDGVIERVSNLDFIKGINSPYWFQDIIIKRKGEAFGF